MNINRTTSKALDSAPMAIHCRRSATFHHHLWDIKDIKGSLKFSKVMNYLKSFHVVPWQSVWAALKNFAMLNIFIYIFCDKWPPLPFCEICEGFP